MNNLKIGIQLYTLREYTEKDFFGTLEKVKEMGYNCVEFAGFGGISAEDMKAKLDSLGLTVVSAHIGIDGALNNKLDSTITYLKTIDCAYYTLPSLPAEYRFGHPDFYKNIKVLKEIAAKLADNGISLLYHNHSFEFEITEDKIPLDVLYSEIPAPLLQPQFDTCWVKFAGYDPVEYINKYSGNTPVIHLKDFYADKMGDRESLELRPLGMGVQNIPEIIKAGIASGCGIFIYEQDSGSGRTMMEAAKLSRDYLRSIGY